MCVGKIINGSRSSCGTCNMPDATSLYLDLNSKPMNEENVRQTIFRLLKNIAPDTQPELLKPDDNIRHTLGIDSFDYLQFIIGLDEALSIQTAEEDYGKVETLSALLNYVRGKQK